MPAAAAASRGGPPAFIAIPKQERDSRRGESDRDSSSNMTPVDPPHRVSTTPWFVSRRRPKAMLAVRTHVLSPRQAMRVVRQLLGPDYVFLQELLFADFTHRKDGFRYTLMVTWTHASATVRQALFDNAERIVEATGWYPVVQGERLRSSLSFHDFLREHRKTQPSVQLGDLRSVESAVSSDGGCALRLRTTQASLLLDTGLPGALELHGDDAAVLLSHTHRDHSGGLGIAFENALNIVMAETTGYVFREFGWVDPSVLKTVQLVGAGEELSLGRLRVRAFPVPHAPGAVGYVITDGATSVVYSGDVSLQSDRHDFLPRLTEVLASADGTRWLLLDATMAGRSQGASHASPAEDVLLATTTYDDVIITAQDAELLLYAYLDVYKRMTDRPREEGRFPCLVDPTLRPVFRLLHAGATRRAFDEIDPFMLAQYGRRSLSWGESAWLYWLETVSTFPSNGRVSGSFPTPICLACLGRRRVRRCCMSAEVHRPAIWQLCCQSTPRPGPCTALRKR